MKKSILKIVSLVMLCVIIASQAFASNVYYPGGQIVSSYATNYIDPYLQKSVSDKVRMTFSAMECKNLVQDVNALGTVYFGRNSYIGGAYTQDPIEWIILEKNDFIAVLLSKYVLGETEYNEANEPIEYAGSKISKWVGKFELSAFSDAERGMIGQVTIPTVADIDKYFTYIDGTKKLGLAQNGQGLADYWLRNETLSHSGMYFSTYGHYYEGQFGERFGVRPMIIIYLSPLGQ